MDCVHGIDAEACATGGSSGAYKQGHDPFMYFNDVVNRQLREQRRPVPGSAGLVSTSTVPVHRSSCGSRPT